MSLLTTFDPRILKQINRFSLFRLVALGIILLTTIFLKQEVLGILNILQIYLALAVTFFISLLYLIFWSENERLDFFIRLQLLYDILLTSFLIFLTGINESIFLFCYLLNIVLASIIYQIQGSLVIASVSSILYSLIFYVNRDTSNTTQLYNMLYNVFLFLITALLSGQLMEEFKKQSSLLLEKESDINQLKVINDKLLNNIPIGILLVDQNDFIKNINGFALRLLELGSIPQVALRYYELIPSLKNIEKRWNELSEKRKLRFGFEHHITSKNKKKFSLQIVEIENEKNKILVFQDISKILELEEKLKMESRLAASGQLAAAIAHEIRNPLTSISGSIETIYSLREEKSEEETKLVKIALSEIKRLNQLIIDFLQFAKPRENKNIIFPLKKLLVDVVEPLKSRGQSSVERTFAISVSENFEIYGDPERFKQIFLNLFLNSIEAAINNSIQITIIASQDNDQSTIQIIDNGHGVPDDLSEKIFDPFFSTKTYGTGLGLSTVAQIIKYNGGSISSIPAANGAHFEIILPRGDQNGE